MLLLLLLHQTPCFKPSATDTPHSSTRPPEQLFQSTGPGRPRWDNCFKARATPTE
jgi:hypothetical protein